MRSLKKELSVVITLLTCFFFVVIQKEYSIISGFDCLRKRKEERNRTILYWNPSHYNYFSASFDPKHFARCAYSNCLLTSNKSEIPVEDFDAIIFESGRKEKFTKPKIRNANQVYIFAARQSPLYTMELSKALNFFNWTMTYREDSDIVWKHGYLLKARTPYVPPSIRSIRKRKRKVAWIAEQCYLESSREEVVHKLSTHYPVEIFGKCGVRPCPKDDIKECFKMIQRHYKFYLSFENSVCKDYVSEELFEALKYDIVPIVWGGANYSSFLGPKYVVNLMNFQKVSELVAHLTYLDTNIPDYLQYFEWKKSRVVVTESHQPFCELCRKLNRPLKPKTYDNMAKWWAGPGYDKCTNSVVFES